MEFLKKKGEALFALIGVLAILGLVVVITLGSIIGKEIKMGNFINKLPGIFGGLLSSLNWTLYEASQNRYTKGVQTLPFFGTDPYNPLAYFNIPKIEGYGPEIATTVQGFFGVENLFQRLKLYFDYSVFKASGTVQSIKLQPK
jgi:hypothetical protein